MSRLLLMSAAVSAALITLTACGSSGSADVSKPKPKPGGDPGQVEPSPRPAPGQGDGDAPDAGEGMSADECDKVPEGEPLAEGQVLTGTLSCGDTIVGHTKGGVNRFNTKFYEANHCTPALRDHDSGDERVYELILPEGEYNADITMYSPCANLSLSAMKVAEGIPDRNSKIRVCEMNPVKGRKPERVHIVSQRVNRWIVVVEGEDDDEGAFELKVECKKGLY